MERVLKWASFDCFSADFGGDLRVPGGRRVAEGARGLPGLFEGAAGV